LLFLEVRTRPGPITDLVTPWIAFFIVTINHVIENFTPEYTLFAVNKFRIILLLLCHNLNFVFLDPFAAIRNPSDNVFKWFMFLHFGPYMFK